MEDSEAASAPQDVANLYSWAGLDETKYRMFAASREEARAQTLARKGMAEAEAARRYFEEAEMLRRAADEVTASPEVDVVPQVVEPAIEEGVRPRQEDGVAFSWGDGSDGRMEDEVETRSSGASSDDVGELDVSDRGLRAMDSWEREKRQEDHDAERRWQEESSSKSRPAQRSAAAKREVSEVPSRLYEPEFRPAMERERQSPARMGQPIHLRSRENEDVQPRRRREEPRWSALQNFFTHVEDERGGLEPAFNAPALAVFSLMGGVGKTSMVAALGRIFAGEDERVLLLDANAYGVLPFYFGARSLRPGLVRSFSQGATLPPIQVLSIDPEIEIEGGDRADWLPQTLFRDTRGLQRVLIDVATGSAAMMRRVLQLSPKVLVPLQPNMMSVVNLQAVEGFLRRHGGEGKSAPRAHYILSQFDASLALHRDVQEVLRQQLGDRLLPFVMRRSAAVNEALAEGTTVVDYAPDSAVVDDLMRLSAWVRSAGERSAVSAPALRWREL